MFYYLTYYIISIKIINLSYLISNECRMVSNIILITWTLEYRKDAWNRQQFILWPGNSLTVSWCQKSATKLWKQLEMTNYILYSRLIGNKTLIPWFLGNSQTVVPRSGDKSWQTVPSAFHLGQVSQISPLTSGQQFDCSPWSHGISVYMYNVKYNS